MVAWRKAPGGPGAPPVVREVAAWVATLERCGGPPVMLDAARSWLAMLGDDPDPVLADLCAEMVRTDRAIWLGVRGGVA